MSNPFRKKTHELTEIDRLKQKAAKAMNLEQQITHLNHEARMLQNQLNIARQQAEAYQWLREQELMLMTSDGVKYLKGEDLDAYVTEQTTPMNLQESVLNRLTKHFNDALRQGLNSNQIMWASKVDIDTFAYETQGRKIYGDDAGKEG